MCFCAREERSNHEGVPPPLTRSAPQLLLLLGGGVLQLGCQLGTLAVHLDELVLQVAHRRLCLRPVLRLRDGPAVRLLSLLRDHLRVLT